MVLLQRTRRLQCQHACMVPRELCRRRSPTLIYKVHVVRHDSSLPREFAGNVMGSNIPPPSQWNLFCVML